MIKIVANLISAEPLVASFESPESNPLGIKQTDSFPPATDSGSPWSISTLVALFGAIYPVGCETVHDLGSVGKPDG
jgi:hypothetical protein